MGRVGLPPPADEPSVETRIFEAMDRAALTWIEMLDSKETDEDGDLKVPIDLRMKLFEKGQEWLVKRQKLRPKTMDDAEGEGIRDMREWINSPDVRATLDTMMTESGYVKVPPKRPGRPTKAEEPMRARYKEFKQGQKDERDKDDDSGWQKLLGGEEGED